MSKLYGFFFPPLRCQKGHNPFIHLIGEKGESRCTFLLNVPVPHWKKAAPAVCAIIVFFYFFFYVSWWVLMHYIPRSAHCFRNIYRRLCIIIALTRMGILPMMHCGISSKHSSSASLFFFCPAETECFICRDVELQASDPLRNFCDCKNLLAHHACLSAWIQTVRKLFLRRQFCRFACELE